jgi:gluconate 5-dehydrogenase
MIEPQYDNRVYLLPGTQDDYGMPRMQVEFSYSNQDRALIPELYRTMDRAVAGMKLTMEGQPRQMVPGEDNHECGTCRMGLDPETSVTDPYGQVHGVGGLFVADNSVVRLSGPFNPTLTTVALAIRTADYIAGRIIS